jgi:hypothetical protein
VAEDPLERLAARLIAAVPTLDRDEKMVALAKAGLLRSTTLDLGFRETASVQSAR